MKSMITNYCHRTGEHCGSTVMRNMLLHYCGLDISEAFTFGLGSGIEFLYIRSPEIDPEAVIFGRSATLEQDLSEALGIDYIEEPEFDNDKAWEDIRREILEGRPAVVCCDIFYMDHRKYDFHFPFNRFVLVGFDDEIRKAYIHDRVNLSPQPVSYKALALSRNPTEYPIYNLWGRFCSKSVKRSLEEACLRAVKKTARRMTNRDDTQKKFLLSLSEGKEWDGGTGLEALRMFRKELPYWLHKDKADWMVSYASQTIEKVGNGGGHFRKMYAAFLEEARAILPDIIDEKLPVLTARSGDLWTSLSQSLNNFVKEKENDSWETSLRLIDQIISLETDIFNSMLGKFPE